MSCCLWCNSVWAKGCHGNKKTFSEYGACLTSAGRSLANNSTVVSRDTQFVHGRNKDDKTVQNTSHLGLSTIGKSLISYLSFFLHKQNFWRVKFTPKNRVNYDKIRRKLPIFCVITAKYTVNCQFFALNL